MNGGEKKFAVVCSGRYDDDKEKRQEKEEEWWLRGTMVGGEGFDHSGGRKQKWKEKIVVVLQKERKQVRMERKWRRGRMDKNDRWVSERKDWLTRFRINEPLLWQG